MCIPANDSIRIARLERECDLGENHSYKSGGADFWLSQSRSSALAPSQGAERAGRNVNLRHQVFGRAPAVRPSERSD
jgi:hypothetical protein